MQIHLQTNLQYYLYPPLDTIDMHEFDELIKWRLKGIDAAFMSSRKRVTLLAVLQAVENANKRHGKDANAMAKSLHETLAGEFPIAVRPVSSECSAYREYTRTNTPQTRTVTQATEMVEKLEQEQRRKDHISHWLLQLAFCNE